MIDECNTWFVSANLSRSNDVGRTEALLLSAQQSARSSLKFKNRLLTEGTWQACVCRQTRNLTQPLAAASTRDWKATVCAFIIRAAGAVLTCGCIHFSQSTGDAAGWETRKPAEPERKASVRCRFHLAGCVSVLPVNVRVLIVCVLQISTWSPSRAPPFLPRN